jgi:hypothetical protein
MIFTKNTPFTKEEIAILAEEFEDYIKTVVDLEKRVCSAGGHMHFDNEQILLRDGSERKNLWGGGVDLLTKKVQFSSLINIRSPQNSSDEIIIPEIRVKFEELMKFFFQEVWI